MISLVSEVQAGGMSITIENNGRVDGRKDQAVFHVGRLEYLRREQKNFIGVRKNSLLSRRISQSKSLG